MPPIEKNSRGEREGAYKKGEGGGRQNVVKKNLGTSPPSVVE